MKPPAVGSKWESIMKLRLARAAGKRINRLSTAGSPAKPIPAPVSASAQSQETTMKTKSKKKTTYPKARKAKAPAKPRSASKKAAAENARAPAGTPGGVREGSKLAIVVGLLTRDGGCTGKEILEATKWPTVSVPQQAKAAGLTLRKEKIDGVTRYSASAPAQ